MPNSPKDQDLVARLSQMMQRHLTRLAWSDERLLEEMKSLSPKGILGRSGSQQTIQRYKNGTSESHPSARILGLIGQALGVSDAEREWVREGGEMPRSDQVSSRHRANRSTT
jgi:transcriptional regulator with XRE-family HTH domain